MSDGLDELKKYTLTEFEDLCHKLNKLTDHKMQAVLLSGDRRDTIQLNITTPQNTLAYRHLTFVRDLQTLVDVLELVKEEREK